MGSRMVWWMGVGGGGGGGDESGAVLGQVSTLASGVLLDPHELLDKVADMPVVVPQPDKVVFVPVVQIVQVPLKLVVEVVEIPQLQLIEKIAAIPGVGGVVAQKTVEVPQLQFVDEVVVFPVVAQRLFPMVLTVQSTIADPQLQPIDKVADVLRVHVVQVPQVQVVRISRVSPLPGAGRGEDSRDPTVAPYQHDKLLTCPLLSTTGAYGPDSAENCVRSDHRDSTVAVLLNVVDVPVVKVVQAPQWWRMSRSHSCRSSSFSGSSLYGGGGGEWGFLPVLWAFFALRPSGR